ncbi:hypothetical protein [Serinibacter salmoneus]|uniref:hypothetical protein n=1 Tax=Serinibacter salmoneus TaxID=556530 RepID=UPI001179E4D8|nr:hypothetical protein [Serinibacter salmoneus]
MVLSLATLFSIPLLIRGVGDELWLSIAVGQSVGELCRATVIWSWNSIGLTRSAPMSRPARLRYYFESLRPRLIVLALVIPIAVAACFLIPLSSPVAAILSALTGAVYGLSGAWVLIGSDRPILLLLIDSIPRALSILVGAVIAGSVGVVWVFGLVTVLGSCMAVLGPYSRLRREARALDVDVRLASFRVSLAHLREGLPVVGAALLNVGRISFAVIVSPILNAALAPAVALGDKFLRWANTGMTPLMQSLQVRVSRGSGDLQARALRGIVAAWLVGGTLGLGTIVVIPLASGPVSAGTMSLGLDVAVPLGLVVTLYFAAGITGNSVMVLLGRIRALFWGAVGSGIVLVVAFVLLYSAFGVPGAFWALACSEGTLAIYQMWVVWAGFRRLRAEANARREVNE